MDERYGSKIGFFVSQGFQLKEGMVEKVYKTGSSSWIYYLCY